MTAPMNVADLDRVAGAVLDVLWRSSWQASVLAVVVLLVQFMLRRHLSARWRHALWGIVLLRLIIPVTPPSPWSLFNVAPQPAPRSGILIVTNTVQSPLAVSPQSPRSPQVPQSPHPWKVILVGLWLAGLALMAPCGGSSGLPNEPARAVPTAPTTAPAAVAVRIFRLDIIALSA